MQMHSVATKGRHADLARPHHDGLFNVLAHVNVALDVLDGHNGLIHQNAHRQRQTPQGHEIERFAQRSK